MLRKLKIENLAVIDSVEFELEAGLCALTGETGAGKTLVVGAIELLLGARADSGKVRTGEESAIVEGIFERGGKSVFVRRKITAGGRSYAWIDGEPVTMSELADRTAGFADLLGQHEHQSLLDSATHTDLLDDYAGSRRLSGEFRQKFHQLEEFRVRLSRLKRQLERAREKSRLREYEIRELSDAKLDADEWAEVEGKLARVDSAEHILARTDEAIQAIGDGQPNAVELIAIAEKAMADIAGLVPEVADVAELLDTAQTAIAEALRELSAIAGSVDIDPEEAEYLRGRQSLIERLKRKYNRDVPGLIEYLAELEAGEEDIARIEEEIDTLEREVARVSEKLVEIAGELRRQRELAVPNLCAEIERALAPLGMDAVRFEVALVRAPDSGGAIEIDGERFALLPTGSEGAEFLISPNPGEELRPLASIVSGGELSRIMLAIKALIRSEDFEGITVFDEVDAGIGGEVGNAVGEELKRLARNGQILVITHLPQIARLADVHLRIGKFERAGRTRVSMLRLEGSTRKEELKRMHGGEPNILIEV